MISPARWPKVASTVLRTYGVRGAYLRARHEVRRSVGAFRGSPRYAPTRDDGVLDCLVVDRAALKAACDSSNGIARSERVLAGEYDAFRWNWQPLPRSAAEWHTNPRTAHRYDANAPWWRVRHVDPRAGDIKDTWEPARFGWTYDLIRGALVTGRDEYAAAFHDRLATWAEANPPFTGVHWSCGQETAIRAIALLHAEANLRTAPSSDAAGMERLRAVLGASGERIADALGYAISQRNNHGISEAAALIALGRRFAGSHPEATRWTRIGRRWMNRLIVEQFAPDGWYIQHSFTYLRLALDQCVFVQQVLSAGGESLSNAAIQRLRSAVDLLMEVVEPATGIVPNHGANDGALVRPITSAAYRDFRATMTAACAMFGFTPCGDVAADREVLAWLGRPAPTAECGHCPGGRAGSSGWACASVGKTRVFLRAGRYTSRPSHADALHVDVAVDGQELVVDPGTYAYMGVPPWRNPFASGRFHNGPLPNGGDSGLLGPRFLWLEWPRATLLDFERDRDHARIVAEVPGIVRRSVLVEDGLVTVVDEPLESNSGDRFSIRWLLHPSASTEFIRCSAPATWISATETDPIGWFSPHYGERVKSRVLCVDAPARSGEAIVTWIGRRAQLRANEFQASTLESTDNRSDGAIRGRMHP